MRTAKFIVMLTAALLAVWSCQKEKAYTEKGGSKSGSIVLSLSSTDGMSLQTRDEIADELADGLRFKNVLVVLTDNTGKVVDKKYKAYPYDPADPGNDPEQVLVSGTSVQQDVIKFDGLLPGNYTAYAYANIDRTEWQSATASEQILNQEYTVSAGDDFTPYLSRELKVMTGDSDIPGNPTTAMLLTGKLTIPVGLTVVNKELELRRPVARLKVTINNNTAYPIRISDLYFSHLNPDRAYIIGREDGGVPVIPTGVSYREMPPFDPSGGDVATVPAESATCVYSRLIYENVSSYIYKIFTDMTLVRSDLDPAQNLELSLGGLAFGMLEFQAVQALDETEFVNVLLVNPRTTTRGGRLYYGIGDTGLAWESCGYSDWTRFHARAQVIYRESSAYQYDGFTYSGYQSNKSGLAGWSGNAADAPLKETDGTTHKMTFNYSGKRSTYFHKLKKLNGKYTLEGLTTNPPSGTSISNLKLVAGWNVSGRFPSSPKNDKYFFQFVNDDSSDPDYGKYLRSDNQYNAGSEAVAKQCRLHWDDGGQNQHDHMFVLYGKYCGGGRMKRLLTGSNKEVDLTYMKRNEDLNVVINVYYADTEGTVNFRVDNSNWTEAGATMPTHTFE